MNNEQKQFRYDNTEGYTDAELQKLNDKFDHDAQIIYETENRELHDYEIQNLSEKILSEFDDNKKFYVIDEDGNNHGDNLSLYDAENAVEEAIIDGFANPEMFRETAYN